MWKPGALTNQPGGFNAHSLVPKLIKCCARGSLSSLIIHSGGIVTRDMIGAQSYLEMFLLGILKQPHAVFVPLPILSHPVPPTFSTLLLQVLSQVLEMQQQICGL